MGTIKQQQRRYLTGTLEVCYRVFQNYCLIQTVTEKAKKAAKSEHVL